MAVSGTHCVSKKKSQTPKASKKEDQELNPSPARPDDAHPIAPSPRKRTKAPGVRVIGGRIYDSANGQTCHQCRQKTRDFSAACKNMKKGKQCTIRFCHKCLLNRYGEIAEEVNKADSWTCPKCRAICNCSFCMKKKGQQPTGILTHAAKATGFSSVSEMLLCGVDLDKYHHTKSPQKDLHISRELTSKEVAPKKRKADCELSSAPQTDSKHLRPKSTVKRKCPQFKNGPPQQVMKGNISEEAATTCNQMSDKIISNSMNLTSGNSIEKKKPKQRVSKRSITQPSDATEEDSSGTIKEDRLDAPKCEISENKSLPNTQTERQNTPSVNCKNIKKVVKRAPCDPDFDVLLPQGEEMKTVADIELSADDVGPALQFLEFCCAFGEVLDLGKGHAEAVLRELIRGRTGRHGLYSSIAQFHTKLLELIQDDMDEGSPISLSSGAGNSWLKQLHKYISESPYAVKELTFHYPRGPEGYSKLDPSQKLRVLNFLCNKAIGTERLRGFIEEENLKFLERKKECDENITEVNKKEKDMKQKLKDEMARVYLSSRTDTPISIAENLNIVSKIRKATNEAHAEKLKALELKSKLKKNRSDAVRTEHIVFDKTGRTYWRLRGCSSGSRIMLQDVGNPESFSSHDKWFVYDEQQEKALEKYISSLRERCKCRKSEKIADVVMKENIQQGSPVDSSSPGSAVEDAKMCAV